MSIHIAKRLKPNSSSFHRWEHPEADTIHSFLILQFQNSFPINRTRRRRRRYTFINIILTVLRTLRLYVYVSILVIDSSYNWCGISALPTKLGRHSRNIIA